MDKVKIFKKIVGSIKEESDKNVLLILRDELNALWQGMDESEQKAIRKSWNKYRK